jgi:hypothetical protein
MRDNFEQITKYLNFGSSDDFYYCSIIKRRKENPDLKTNNYMVKSYTITSIDYLENKKEEIITLCKLHNARAYINLNKRSFEVCAHKSLKKLTDVLLSKSYVSATRVFDSVASKHSSDKEKKWLIEHDCNPYGDKVIGVVRTVNGCHLITKPFKIDEFRVNYPDVEIKKNSPTLLYYSK